jgi:Xaa-Pro aminopeptidase
MYFVDDMGGFRRAQRVAYEAASGVGAKLVEGMTEREAAELLRERLVAEGIRHWFHVPFAWFGSRTALAHDGSVEAFSPSELRLELGMPVILDVAPIVDGYAADIGYTLSFGPNARLTQMLDDLCSYRREIVEQLRAGRTRQDVYRYVDARMREQGYDNRHRIYPMEVLGHRVARLEPRQGGHGSRRRLR